MMRLPKVSGHVPPVTYPPLLRVDVLGLVLHLEIFRDPAGSVTAAIPDRVKGQESADILTR
jgi:hypothetical protein